MKIAIVSSHIVRQKQSEDAPLPLPNASVMAIEPRPVVDSRNKVVLLWSAKSGSTFAMKWMFAHMGLLEKALAYDSWIHHYRMHILYPSAEHEAAVQDFCKSPLSYRVVKFVRQPFKRAVSSFAHALRYGNKDPRMAALFGEETENSSEFSFTQFVRYLETTDLTKGNIHYRFQMHPLERHFLLPPLFLVNLDHSMDSLPKLEAHFGLPQTDPQRYRESLHHRRGSAALPGQWNTHHVFDSRREMALATADYRSFYNSGLERDIYNLYAEDFLRYGFSTRVDNRSEKFAVK